MIFVKKIIRLIKRSMKHILFPVYFFQCNVVNFSMKSPLQEIVEFLSRNILLIRLSKCL